MTWTGRTLWASAALLSAAIALFAFRYLPHVGPMAEGVLANLYSRPWLVLHVTGAATALLIGPLQFLPRLRARRPALHRWVGRTYVVGCLLGAIAGFVLALGTTAGPIASMGFGALAIVWLIANVQAWRMARERQFVRHRAWMVRSFALTFAAVTLRIYLPLLAFLPVSMLAGYRAISFLCWVPNILLAELYLRANPSLPRVVGTPASVLPERGARAPHAT